MTLFFIGAGLSPVKDLTLESLDAVDRCEKIYVDTYTGYLDEEVLNFLRRRKGGQLVLASRKMLEDEGVKIVMEAMERDVGIVVAGDPFIATTHQALRSEAFQRKVPVCIVHGISVVSAAASISGLHIYKFGRIATVPRTGDLKQLSQPYQAILDNLALGLHTLLLLDTADGGLTVQEALKNLRSFERDYTHKIFVDELLIIAAARMGLRDFRIAAFRLDQIEHISLPSPPHCMIIPGEMHFTEREFVKTYSTDPHYLDSYTPPNTSRERLTSYAGKCNRILEYLSAKGVNSRYLEYVRSYVDDSLNFLMNRDMFNAFLAMGYAEGLLDALRLRGEVEFSWDGV
ncbi:hypothetical protein HRbin01_00389 [archaeon HR01]|nr:hypothetical protein HRbin01_00389 [archaeon HR01]